ncbi:MAG: hypothetical protein KGZ38_04530 [Erysipelothrix sp.]|nr:hypothetical protein [Erysipelothrix sp.]
MNINNVNPTQPNSWFESKDKNEVTMESFLQLMIAQLKNQDFNNPVDDTQYLTQLAQFSSLKAMQELTQYSKTAYATSLVGKEVTASKMGLGGNLETVSGVVTKISLVNNEFGVFIDDQMFSLNQIMEIKPAK